MPTIFFDSITPHEKIRFALWGNAKMMPHVKTKEIADFSFLTPQHPDFDFRLPAYREDAQYRANPNMPEEFTAIDKMKLRRAVTLAMHIVANGYQAMCNYLRFRNDPDNHDVIKFKKRVKAWFGCDTDNFISFVTPKMRRMQDTLQDRATFVTFVNALNQRMISCTGRFRRIDTPSMGEYLHYVDFYDVNINPIPCSYKAFVQRCRHSGISMGIRLYIVNLCIDNINEIARGIIHELTHKILMTVDEINDTQPIYGAELCRKLTFSDPDLVVTIADNWAFFYMSFGCYPGQQEYDYQAEYEITASDQGHNPSRVGNIFATSKKYQTFNDLDELEALEALAPCDEPKSAKELRTLKAHISRRVYLDNLTAAVKTRDKNKGYVKRKELFDLKQRMEYSESLTNIEPKTPKELKKLEQHMAHLEAMDSREGRERRQRMARMKRSTRR